MPKLTRFHDGMALDHRPRIANRDGIIFPRARSGSHGRDYFATIMFVLDGTLTGFLWLATSTFTCVPPTSMTSTLMRLAARRAHRA